MSGLSIFFKSTNTSILGNTFYQNLNNIHEYLIQQSSKSGGTKDHLRRVEVPGTVPPLIERPAYMKGMNKIENYIIVPFML